MPAIRLMRDKDCTAILINWKIRLVLWTRARFWKHFSISPYAFHIGPLSIVRWNGNKLRGDP